MDGRTEGLDLVTIVDGRVVDFLTVGGLFGFTVDTRPEFVLGVATLSGLALVLPGDSLTDALLLGDAFIGVEFFALATFLRAVFLALGGNDRAETGVFVLIGESGTSKLCWILGKLPENSSSASSSASIASTESSILEVRRAGVRDLIDSTKESCEGSRLILVGDRLLIETTNESSWLFCDDSGSCVGMCTSGSNLGVLEVKEGIGFLGVAEDTSVCTSLSNSVLACSEVCDGSSGSSVDSCACNVSACSCASLSSDTDVC